MQIIELQAENVKRIKAIKITPKDNMVIIEGKNAQGKTSALDCIAYALGGKKLIPDNPIREGQESAFVKINLGEYQVTRTWTKKNTYLKIENKDGFKSTNPQEMLDLLIGDLSFDPMSFCNMDKNKRLETLKSICKLNFDDLKMQYDNEYCERTHLNREIEQLEAQLKPYETLEPLIPVRDLVEVEKERDEISSHNQNIRNAISELAARELMAKKFESDILELQEKIATNNERIKSYRLAASYPIEDVSHLTNEIHEIAKQMGLKKQHEFVLSIGNKLIELGIKRDSCEKKINEVKAEKEKRLQEAQFPINGMSISSSDIIYKGIEFSQLSSSEKIKISMAMAMSLNPRIKIIRILNGSLLDSEAMQKIKEIAKERDYQLWVERVNDKKSENCVYIEDGEIK
jgi:hypothetical protein